jgi:hypothetical protein
MSASAAILEQWLARALGVYGEKVAPLAVAERDPFRNPVGHTLRTHLSRLLHELLGGMDPAVIDASMEQIIAVRAIQDLSVAQALGFVYELRSILRRELPERDAAETDARIDQLSLAAFAQFLKCRERLAELRLNEHLRSLGPVPYRLRSRPPGACAPAGD